MPIEEMRPMCAWLDDLDISVIEYANRLKDANTAPRRVAKAAEFGITEDEWYLGFAQALMEVCTQ